MEKSLEKSILRSLITLIILRVIYVYVMKTPFFSAGCVGMAIGVVLGRIVFYTRNREKYGENNKQEERK